MGRFNSKVNIPVSSHGLHAHRVDCRALDSADFFQLVPIHYRHCLQGDKVDLRGSLFGRTNPLLQAAFVTGSYNYRWFFVPYRTVSKSYVDFSNGTAHAFSNTTYAQVNTARYFDMQLFVNAFVRDTDLVTTNVAVANMDFVFVDSNNNSVNCAFTALGAQLYKVLNGLGYTPIWNAYVTLGNRNAYALLAWMKVFYDWYYPSQYTNSLLTIAIRQMLEDNSTSGLHVDETNLVDNLKGCLYSFYQNDIYDHVWDTPLVGGSNATQSFPVIGMRDPSFVNTAYQNVITNNQANNVGTGTPVVGATNPGSGSGNRIDLKFLSQFALDALQGLNNLMRRFSLVGSRAVDRFLASRGVKMDYVVSDRSLRLAESKFPLHVGDVENNSDTNLGELAGKGVVRSVDDSALKCDFDVPEDGMLILIRTIIPDGGLVTKNDPFNFYTNFYDFYVGEFAKIGLEPVPAETLFGFVDGTNTLALDRVFGWWQRYLGYIVNRNTVIGDFNLQSRGAQSLMQFHSFRELTPTMASQLGVVHSQAFLSSSYDANAYDRIFYTAKSDNFITLQNIVGVHKTLIPPFADSFDWDDDEFNKRVQMHVSGSKVD